MDPRVYGPGGRRPDDPYGQRRVEEPYGAQRRQEDLFAQRGKQEASSGQRGKQEDSYGQRRPQETTSRGKDESPVRTEQYGGKRPYAMDPQRRQDNVTPQRPPTPYDQLDIDESGRSPVAGYSGEQAELHEAPGPAINPALHTMVKMVTMLNFMKVELGETKTLRSKEQWRAAGAEFWGTLMFVYLGCGSVVATGMQTSYNILVSSS